MTDFVRLLKQTAAVTAGMTLFAVATLWLALKLA